MAVRPQVSRRLERRLRKDLQGERYGHVQVGVHAYVQLLKGGQSAATQFAKELLGDEDDPASVGVVRGDVCPTLLLTPHAAASRVDWALSELRAVW